MQYIATDGEGSEMASVCVFSLFNGENSKRKSLAVDAQYINWLTSVLWAGLLKSSLSLSRSKSSLARSCAAAERFHVVSFCLFVIFVCLPSATAFSLSQVFHITSTCTCVCRRF